MRDQTLRIGVSLGALAIAVMHLWKPDLQIDSITGVLLVISVLPWVQPLIKSIELLGMKVELRELQNRVAEAQEAAEGASQQATLALAAPGQSAKLAANGCCGSMMNPKIMNMALLD